MVDGKNMRAMHNNNLRHVMMMMKNVVRNIFMYFNGN